MRQYYAAKTDAVAKWESEHQQKVRELASECIVLLENNGVLPLDGSEKRIALYGTGARQTIKGGTGSGEVNARKTISIEEGFENAGFTITTKDWLDKYTKMYDEAKKAYIEDRNAYAEKEGIPVLMSMFAKPFENPTLPEVGEEDAETTETAIYVLSRNSGEGKDRDYREGDYLLRKDEELCIRFLAEHYKNCIVLLNVGGVIDTSLLKKINGISAILLIGQLGNAGGDIVADVISGRAVPSGKLTDTWAKRYEDYPYYEEFSHNNNNTDEEYYREGIYVGYRYFDTFNVEPSYCFGYGKGYTEFDMIVKRAVLQGEEICIVAEVTNTGEYYPGKETVQVYYSAPQGKLEKPYQELVAFGKTKLLAPKEKDTLRLTFPIKAMASYDEQSAAWIMEKGDYRIRVGNSSRNTQVIAVVTLDQDTVTEYLTNICKGADVPDLLIQTSECKESRETKEKVREDVIRIGICSDQISAERKHYQQERPVLSDCRKQEVLTLEDVKEGNATIEELTAQLTVEEMARLCVGTFKSKDGSGSIVGSASAAVPGAAADTTSSLSLSRKIPNMIFADGPAGLRIQPHFKTTKDGQLLSGGEMFGLDIKPFPEDTPNDAVDYYQYCTAIPIAVSLAQSWNMELIESIGNIVGDEMKRYHVHFWLAPGMNIHRNPLCGRNFEYYSEDPLLSGKCAAADTKGVQSFPGQGTTIKHLAANNQEDNRMFSNSHVTERTLREIYLKGFEIAVKEAQPYGIMTSYNLLNGIHTANHYELIQTVVRDEWGFEGVVMTDWFSSQDTSKLGETSDIYPWSSSVQCIYAGNDLQMPGCEGNVTDIIEAVEKGEELSLGDLQFCVGNILRIALKTI